MTEQTHTRHITDTRTVLAATLKQPNESGVDTVIDLTGLDVEFKMVNQSGVAVIAQTATGVTVTDAAAGEVEYDFSTAGVATAGRYYAYFVVIDSTETDHFPVTARELIVCIEGDA
jgi:hypothetical protein